MPQLKLVSGSHVSRPTNLASRSSLLGCSILIVEDEPLIALDLHASLRAAGAGRVVSGARAKGRRGPPLPVRDAEVARGEEVALDLAKKIETETVCM